jgi:hypothetical protein
MPPEIFRKQQDEILKYLWEIRTSGAGILVSLHTIITILYVNFVNHWKKFTLFLLSEQKHVVLTNCKCGHLNFVISLATLILRFNNICPV